MIDILLVDDYAPVRTGLRMRLSLEPDLRVVGEASNGTHAIHLARRLSPQLIIMDVGMPGMDGIAAASRIKAELDNSEIIILTAEDTLKVYENAKAAGVAAVLPKNDRVYQLISVIRSVMSRQPGQLAVT